MRIENNFIGLGIDGVRVIPNKDGIQYSNIAQPITLVNNVISGNTRTGIRASNTSNQVIIGNKIGVLADGVTRASNGSHGIILHTNASQNRIGGELDGEGNVIANNGGDGVLIGSDPAAGFALEAGVGNSVIRNLIFGNSGLAIELGPNNGVTANDVDDPDTGPNNLQNAPVITLATTIGDSIFITGYSTAWQATIASTFTRGVCWTSSKVFGNVARSNLGHRQSRHGFGTRSQRGCRQLCDGRSHEPGYRRFVGVVSGVLVV